MPSFFFLSSSVHVVPLACFVCETCLEVAFDLLLLRDFLLALRVRVALRVRRGLDGLLPFLADELAFFLDRVLTAMVDLFATTAEKKNCTASQLGPSAGDTCRQKPACNQSADGGIPRLVGMAGLVD